MIEPFLRRPIDRDVVGDKIDPIQIVAIVGQLPFHHPDYLTEIQNVGIGVQRDLALGGEARRDEAIKPSSFSTSLSCTARLKSSSQARRFARTMMRKPEKLA